MGNISAYVNYHTELSFVNDLNDQIYNQGSLNHSTLGNIQLWKIKRNTNLELFSFVKFENYLSQDTSTTRTQIYCKFTQKDVLYNMGIYYNIMLVLKQLLLFVEMLKHRTFTLNTYHKHSPN